jgi:hypothetical protein
MNPVARTSMMVYAKRLQQHNRQFLTHFSVVPAMLSAEQCYWNNSSERRDGRYLIVFVTAVSMSVGSTLAAEPDDQSSRVAYKNLEVQSAAINEDLAVGMPTVDIAIYLGETNGQPHPYVASPDELKASFERAKDIFARAGVQLRLLFVKRATVPAAWLALQANKVTGVSVSPKINAYVGYRSAKWELTNEAKRAFEGIIQKHADNHRTIYLLYLKQVRMAYFDRSNTAGPQIKSIPTGGLSLPSYLFEERIPRRIRGVITICRRSGQGGRTMAHELGHKLINVSHEYRKISPQFEVRGEGGLMIYGKGTDIPSGKTGRWQKERLHRSPYIYRMKADETRTWNADYRENGHYYDPLYGDKIIRFGIMEHPQATK